jgi:hypothetical protein
LVRAAADMGSELREIVAHEDELAVGERAREMMLDPDLRTHFADWEG